MPDIVLRDVNGPSDEDGRELARAWVPPESADAMRVLVERAIGWGHDLSYVEVEDEVGPRVVASTMCVCPPEAVCEGAYVDDCAHCRVRELRLRAAVFHADMARRHAQECPCGPDDPCPTASTLREFPPSTFVPWDA